jgi:hypothetical protein
MDRKAAPMEAAEPPEPAVEETVAGEKTVEWEEEMVEARRGARERKRLESGTCKGR